MKWYNKPLPKSLCTVVLGYENCKVCWPCVGLFTSVIIIMIAISHT